MAKPPCRGPGRRLVPALVFSILAGAHGGARAAPAARDLGRHRDLGPTPGADCRACHPGHPADRRPVLHATLEPPKGANERYLDPIVRSCWVCHRAGNPFGAAPMEGLAFDPRAHGRPDGAVNAPDSWLEGRAVREDYRGSGLPADGAFSCVSCHDAHDGTTPLFLRRAGSGGDVSELCRGCHRGRDNPGLVGGDNLVALAGRPYSTHPTGVPVSDIPGNGVSALGAVDARLRVPQREGADPRLGGHLAAPLPGSDPRPLLACQTCHTVHGSSASPARHGPGLLAIADGEGTTALCLGCHVREAEGGVGWGHPEPAARPEGSSQPPPACASCHDVHGGLPGTSLLLGPSSVAEGFGNWCFTCHPARAILPAGHPPAGAAAETGPACPACHAGDAGGLPPACGAHAGLSRSRDPRFAERLLQGLSSDRQAVRDNAAHVLPQLDSSLFLPALTAILGDPRPGVRAAAARVLGAAGGPESVARLATLLADADPAVRSEAASALGSIGDPAGAPHLTPVLGDADATVAYAAVRALGRIRDPRSFPALLARLRAEPDPDRHRAIVAVLREVNDYRVLELLLEDGREHGEDSWAIQQVIHGLTDPRGLEPLIAALEARHRLVRIAAATFLPRHGAAAVAALTRALADKDAVVAAEVGKALARIGTPAAVESLVAFTAAPGRSARQTITFMGLLTLTRSPRIVDLLIDLTAHPEAAVARKARETLFMVTCRNFGGDTKQWREWWEGSRETFAVKSCR